MTNIIDLPMQGIMRGGNFCYGSVWPDLAIFCTLGDFLKPLATIILLKSPIVLGNFCKGVKIYHF